MSEFENLNHIKIAVEVGYTLIEIVKWVIRHLTSGLQYDNGNGIKTNEPHHGPNKPYYVSNKDTNSTNILPMTESEAEVAAVLDTKAATEDQDIKRRSHYRHDEYNDDKTIAFLDC